MNEENKEQDRISSKQNYLLIFNLLETEDAREEFREEYD